MFKKTYLGASSTPLSNISDYSVDGYSSPFYVKRDDLCAADWSFGGSDMRKLEFLLVDFAQRKITDVIMYSRYSSPFTRAAAICCSRFGIKVHCLFSEEFLPIYGYNLSIIQMTGAETYGTHTHDTITELLEKFTSEGRNVAVLDIGGHRSIAAMAGYALFDEIKLDLSLKFQITDAVIYIGVDSGSTMSGMLAASAHAMAEEEHHISIIGVPIFDNEDTYDAVRNRVKENYAALIEYGTSKDIELDLPELDSDAIVFSDDKLPRSTLSPLLIESTKEFYSVSGVFLDPVYGFHTAMSALVDSRTARHDTRPVVFVNPSLPIIPYFQYTV